MHPIPDPREPEPGTHAPLRALLVYESMFGNTEEVARDVAAGLVDAGVLVQLVEVTCGPPRRRVRLRPAGRRRTDPRLLAQPALDPRGRGAQGRPPDRRRDRPAGVDRHDVRATDASTGWPRRSTPG